MRRKIHDLLVHDSQPLGHALTKGVILLAVAAAVGGAMVASLPETGPLLALLDRRVVEAAFALFVVELLVRFWVAPEAAADNPAVRPWQARLAYLGSLGGLIDLLVALPAVASLVLPVADGWFEMAAALSLLKLARYLPALSLLGAVIRREARPLFAALLLLGVLLVIAATGMYLLERGAQPTVFSSIPQSLWWAIVTMATVGYGDMTPVTALGRLVGGFTMLLGIAMFAVPAGILATGFAEELKKRDFVVTWHTVARVPLFAGLDAGRIAAVARLLKPRVVPANQVIVRKGDPADAMFFLMEGEVEVEVEPQPVRLKAGDFFGEIALLRDLHRTATVTALRDCRLLALEVPDFRELTRQMPDLRRAVEAVAAQRQPGGAVPEGDAPH
ncbi:voltage-gated potassium channel [Tistlia consotensis]|uniref:Voltage-gated potassium channel n=1 Tax=Tistlia consotensis USBA 355 TaxID=560819 RepID=A0A1Y6BEF4_9PROT|nr:cyclic nucleotide-gated ion channel [Tistlia consotensis]SME99266.1 voltage-gated potassium channel [Tistlia consotensis USBA 355]SNR77165.1 voltage-gated potassium channel [Tistlia consotensis]